jgi:acetate kinase
LKRVHKPILVINAGSSSIKFSVFETAADRSLTPSVHGEVAGIGTAPRFSVVDAQGSGLADEAIPRHDHEGAIAAILDWYASHLGGGVALHGVGHRVVHGGLVYSDLRLIRTKLRVSAGALHH